MQKKVTLFGSDCDDGVSARIWFIHKGAKSGCEMVTLFGSDCDDGVSAGIWVIRTGPKSSWSHFLAVTVMMV